MLAYISGFVLIMSRLHCNPSCVIKLHIFTMNAIFGMKADPKQCQRPRFRHRFEAKRYVDKSWDCPAINTVALQIDGICAWSLHVYHQRIYLRYLLFKRYLHLYLPTLSNLEWFCSAMMQHYSTLSKGRILTAAAYASCVLSMLCSLFHNKFSYTCTTFTFSWCEIL